MLSRSLVLVLALNMAISEVKPLTKGLGIPPLFAEILTMEVSFKSRKRLALWDALIANSENVRKP